MNEHVDKNTLDSDDATIEKLEAELRELLTASKGESDGQPSHVNEFVTKIGKYEVLSLLSYRANSIVFLAFDPDLRRQVVVKLYPSDMSTAGRERVLREARTLASIEHDQVAKIHAVEEISKRPVLILEFVDGESLDVRLANQGLTVEESIQIIQQITSAVACVHDCGLIHGDLKPSNVIIDDKNHIKLIDFGLSRTRAEFDSDLPSGTFAYMAPELIKEPGKKSDVRCDVFGIGAIWYELLTRSPPFDGESREAIVAKILNGEIKPVSELKPDTPSGINSACMRSLHFDPDARFQSAAELQLALDGIQTSKLRQTLAKINKTSLALVIGAIVIAVAWLWPLLDRNDDFDVRVEILQSGTKILPQEDGTYKLVDGLDYTMVITPNRDCYCRFYSKEAKNGIDYTCDLEFPHPEFDDKMFRLAGNPVVFGFKPSFCPVEEYFFVIASVDKPTENDLALELEALEEYNFRGIEREPIGSGDVARQFEYKIPYKVDK